MSLGVEVPVKSVYHIPPQQSPTNGIAPAVTLTVRLIMQGKEEYEQWMSIDEDIPVAATLTDLEIYQAIKVDDSDGDECVVENPPMKTPK
ncbi:hypothetical protein AVEN_114119-1 [Araneus ventricosus]|uniref:Uncharacterized protein n=1 Tax=Araneus ventricosus TaxID=182803 RepID=A0A4Y2BWI4_ARAVE|nr:hypothetical protein AVEN_114119-1 [Araneus ventricosus]